MELAWRLVVEMEAKIGKVFFGCEGEVVRLEELATTTENNYSQCCTWLHNG